MKTRWLLSVLVCAVFSRGFSGNSADLSHYIVQISDPQLGFIEQNRSCIPEVDLFTEAIRKINSLSPHAVVITGDLVHSPRDSVQLHLFQGLLDRFDSNIPVWILPGNHDIGKATETGNLSHYLSRYGYDRFFFSDDNVSLIGINTCLIKDAAAEEEEQYIWLQEVLAGSKHGMPCLVFGHHSFFLKEIEEEEGYFNQLTEKRKKYGQLFHDYGVKCYFSGHLHHNSEGCWQGVEYVTTSSIGKQLGDALPGVRVIRVCGESVQHHYFSLTDLPEAITDLEPYFTAMEQ